MFKTLKNAFKIKEIRNRLLYTLMMLVVIRFGSQLPVPGTNRTYFASWFASQTSDAFSFFNAFTGGSFSSFSILALSITPYITSSIIIQLLTIAIPKLEEMQRDGEEGRKKIAAMTRYVTVALALIQSTALAVGFGRQGLLEEYNAFNVITVIAALTAGSAFLMWVGEQITEKGVGNGISIVLVINILSTIPSDFEGLAEQFVFGKAPATAILAVVIIAAIVLGIIAFIVVLNSGVHKIPVQYAQKVQGRRSVGGASSNIPLKVNTSGVIPVIFASTILQTPSIICSLFGVSASGVGGEIIKVLSSSYWFSASTPVYSIGVVLYVAMIIGFAYFYTSVTFNPMMIEDNIKRQGGFIPGIRPGKPTTEYLTKVLHYIVFIGAIGLAFVAIVPYIFSGVFNASVSFGGTSLIIIVSVTLETLEQIESQMLVRNYKGFLNS